MLLRLMENIFGSKTLHTVGLGHIKDKGLPGPPGAGHLFDSLLWSSWNFKKNEL